uniref:Hexosyltransferase n=1 Tax=Myripristis murdjan TaxID=586833 RepID=A0A667ZD60_9TELE
MNQPHRVCHSCLLSCLTVGVSFMLLICLCTPCILLTDRVHFIASGTYTIEGLAPLPKTFWDPHPHSGALWNHLQLVIDRHYNPILSPKNTERGTINTSHESLLQQSFSTAHYWENMTEFAKLPQQMQNFASNMHKRDYPILIQPNVTCGAGAEEEEEPPLLLLAIKTTEENYENRQAIRESWGQVGWVAGRRQDSYVRRVFLLGRTNHKEQGAYTELLQQESQRYGDILQWDFTDSFFNLTLKDVLFWGWFSHHCDRTHFIFKGDDDIFVNIPAMIDYLQDQLQKPKAHKAMRDFMVGDVIGAAQPIREYKSKYFVPASFYKGFYPAYAGGGGVVYSGLLTKRLNIISKSIHLFPIDDVYVGMCMIRLKAYPIHNPAFLTFDFPGKEESKPCAYHTILLVHKRIPSQIVTLWARLKDTKTQCLNVTLRNKTNKHKNRNIAPKKS